MRVNEGGREKQEEKDETKEVDRLQWKIGHRKEIVSQ